MIIETIDENFTRIRIIDKARIEKAKQYKANIARDNFKKIQVDPTHNENYLKLVKVVKTYNAMRKVRRIEDANQRLKFANLMMSLEFAVKMINSFKEWCEPLSSEQMVYVEKAIALIDENCDLLI